MDRDDSGADAQGAWPRLTREQIEELSGHGRRRASDGGEVLFDIGDSVESSSRSSRAGWRSRTTPATS